MSLQVRLSLLPLWKMLDRLYGSLPRKIHPRASPTVALCKKVDLIPQAALVHVTHMHTSVLLENGDGGGSSQSNDLLQNTQNS